MKLETPKEILKRQPLINGPMNDVYIEYGDVIDAIKDAQLQAVQYTLQKAAENAEAIEGWNTGFSGSAASVNKDSILSLEQEILRDLGHEC